MLADSAQFSTTATATEEFRSSNFSQVRNWILAAISELIAVAVQRTVGFLASA
jgi:hypothetical protein